MTTRCDPLAAIELRGEISSVLRALIAIAPDALTASPGRFTKNGRLPGSGAFTRIACSVPILLCAASMPWLPRANTSSPVCRDRGSLTPGTAAPTPTDGPPFDDSLLTGGL